MMSWSIELRLRVDDDVAYPGRHFTQADQAEEAEVPELPAVESRFEAGQVWSYAHRDGE